MAEHSRNESQPQSPTKNTNTIPLSPHTTEAKKVPARPKVINLNNKKRF
jgi:hypothetical protein